MMTHAINLTTSQFVLKDKLSPVVAIQETYSYPEVFEVFWLNRDCSVEAAILNCAAHHCDGYWWDAGFGDMFDNVTQLQKSSIEELSLSFARRFDAYLKPERSRIFLLKDLEGVFSVIHNWNQKIFVAITDTRYVVFCYSNAE